MQEVFIARLHQYITDNRPDLLIILQQEGGFKEYLKKKVAAIDPLFDQLLAANTPAYIIEEHCMEELTKELRPSKYNYLNAVLEEEFEANYYRLKESGLLPYEVMNLIEVCRPVFETFDFTEKIENDRHLRYAIIGAIKEYFENKL